jgi:hypothetical protein
MTVITIVTKTRSRHLQLDRTNNMIHERIAFENDCKHE